VSDTLRLVCTKHREALWVGQAPYGEPSKAYLYTVPDALEKLQRFIKIHAFCEPILLNEEAQEKVDPDLDFSEFEESNP
jgi:hypothetical protein